MPPTTSVVPAESDFVVANVALFSVTNAAVSTVAAPPLNVTLPPFALKDPPVTVTAPVIVKMPVEAVNDPPLIASGPFTVTVEVPPTKAPPNWLNPEPPTVIATPGDCVIVPLYAAVSRMPPTLIATFIVASFDPVASNVATSAAPGISPPSQLPASFQLFVGPSPVHVLVAAATDRGMNRSQQAHTITIADTATARVISRRRVTRASPIGRSAEFTRVDQTRDAVHPAQLYGASEASGRLGHAFPLRFRPASDGSRADDPWAPIDGTRLGAQGATSLRGTFIRLVRTDVGESPPSELAVGRR